MGRLLPDGGVVQGVRRLTDYLWKLTYKWACWSTEQAEALDHRPVLGKFGSRNDRWVFGDRDAGAYLPKPSWTDIVRHTLVKGGASPDDPAWPGTGATPQKVKPPGLLHRAPAIQAGRAVQPSGENLLHPDQPPSPGLGTLVPVGHQEGDHGGLPGPPRHAQRRRGKRTHLVHATCHRTKHPSRLAGNTVMQQMTEPPSGCLGRGDEWQAGGGEQGASHRCAARAPGGSSAP